MGGQGEWCVGPGSHSRRLYAGHGSAFGRAGSLPDILSVRQEGADTLYCVLDDLTVRQLGGQPAARPVLEAAFEEGAEAYFRFQ